MLKRIYRYTVYRIRFLIGEEKYFLLQLRKNRILQARNLSRIRKKEKINVVFFLIHESVWKYDQLFQLFQKDLRFNPIVLVCPYIIYGEENMLIDMENAYQYASKKGYQTIKSKKDNGGWVDVNKELEADIIFFSNPHNLTKPEYYINNFLDKLTCYVPYNFGNSHLLKMFHDQNFHNIVWKLFAETEIHKQYSVQYARNKGKNVFVSGFPGTDTFLLKEDTCQNNLWKQKDTKKIIWAPHHTIDDDKEFISFSSFKLYHAFIYSLLDFYENKIEIIFKPHPLLKVKLYNDPDWGRDRTDKYYQNWKDHPFGGLNESEYIDLFKSSDALIHDSGSFLIEYLYTEKPVLRTDRDETICERLNSFGEMAYNVHYIAKNQQEIERFIEMVIQGMTDDLKQKRKDFKNHYLLPPHQQTASKNIFNFIKSKLK